MPQNQANSPVQVQPGMPLVALQPAQPAQPAPADQTDLQKAMEAVDTIFDALNITLGLGSNECEREAYWLKKIQSCQPKGKDADTGNSGNTSKGFDTCALDPDRKPILEKPQFKPVDFDSVADALVDKVYERVLGKLSAFIQSMKSGPAGLQGERGPQGDVGPQGLQGAQGARGEKGDRGERGIDGQDGKDAVVDYNSDEFKQAIKSVIGEIAKEQDQQTDKSNDGKIEDLKGVIERYKQP